MKEFDLEEAVRLYSNKLFRYVYTLLCDYHEAEDIVQDVFIATYRGQAHFDGENISAWLYYDLKARGLLYKAASNP